MIKNIIIFSFILIFQANFLYANESTKGYADIIEPLLPSVVSIASTTIIKENQQEIPQFPEGSPFEEFFKEYFEQYDNEVNKKPLIGLGSGFIIDDKGIVVTNNHVIEGADEITVIMEDGKEFAAKVMGRDLKADIAVIKFEPKNTKLVSAKWGDSESARVGDLTIAIGNPLGFGNTVTTGIVSAIARDIGGGPYVQFIQTDASINRGNSGGPLYNSAGEVIGINSAIISQSGGSIGLGFAIPSNLAKKIVYQLIEFGRTKRGWLGVQIQNVTDEIAESLDLSDNDGAFVASVQGQSPAKEAGIEAGDIILEFNGNKIKTYRDLPRLVADTDVDTIVSVKIWRKNKIIDLSIKLGELDETSSYISKKEEKNIPDLKIEDLGIAVREISEKDYEAFALENDVKGVIVSEIINENIDLYENDIIIEINREKISNVDQFKENVINMKKTGRKSVLLRIIRENNTIWVTLKFLQ